MLPNFSVREFSFGAVCWFIWESGCSVSWQTASQWVGISITQVIETTHGPGCVRRPLSLTRIHAMMLSLCLQIDWSEENEAMLQQIRTGRCLSESFRQGRMWWIQWRGLFQPVCPCKLRIMSVNFKTRLNIWVDGEIITHCQSTVFPCFAYFNLPVQY